MTNRTEINPNSSREKLRGALATNLATDDVAEQHPAHSCELHELKLLGWSEISRAGVDLDTRQKAFQLQALDAGGVLHDVLPGKKACCDNLDGIDDRSKVE